MTATPQTAAPRQTLTLAEFTLPPQRDVYERHRDVEALADGLPGRLLWAEPRPGRVVVQAGGPLPAPDAALDLGPQLAALAAGDRVRWALIGNPTECLARHAPDGSRMRGVRTVLPEDRRRGWVERKLAPVLEITRLLDEPLPAAAGTKRGRRICHARHAYAGTGFVSDADALREAVAAGVGHGKAFGCGLLLIKQVDR